MGVPVTAPVSASTRTSPGETPQPVCHTAPAPTVMSPHPSWSTRTSAVTRLVVRSMRLRTVDRWDCTQSAVEEAARAAGAVPATGIIVDLRCSSGGSGTSCLGGSDATTVVTVAGRTDGSGCLEPVHPLAAATASRAVTATTAFMTTIMHPGPYRGR